MTCFFKKLMIVKMNTANLIYILSNYCCGLGLPPNIKTILQFISFTGLPLVFMMLGKMSFPFLWKMMTHRSKHLPTPIPFYYRPKPSRHDNSSPSDMADFMRRIINRHFGFLLCIILGTIILTTIVSYQKLKRQRRVYRQRAKVNKVAARVLSFHMKGNTFFPARKNLTYKAITSQLSEILTRKGKHRSKSLV